MTQEQFVKKIKTIIKWLRYINVKWYRNHPLGMRGFVTNRKGTPEYCYQCGNFSNDVIKMYKIFNVPICRKHLDERLSSNMDPTPH